MYSAKKKPPEDKNRAIRSMEFDMKMKGFL
jgi:hypothetical protein